MLDFEIIWCTYELWTFHEDFLSPPALLPEQLSKSVKREQRNESDLGKNFRESTGGLRKISSKVRSADMHRTISKSMKREQRNTLDLEKWLPKETNGIKKKKKFIEYKLNKSSSQRMSLSISQYGGCSNTYNTQTSTKVVFRRFGTRASHPEGLDLERGTHRIGVPEIAPDRIGLVARVVRHRSGRTYTPAKVAHRRARYERYRCILEGILT